MVERWLQANRDCEAAGDWKPLADMYTEDATYGWNYGPTTDFMAIGREEIRELALGAEMGGLDGWEYPYEEILIDDQQGFVVGLLAPGRGRQAPRRHHVRGRTASAAAGSATAATSSGRWQRDLFDFGNAGALFLEMMSADKLSEGMTARMHRSMSGPLPGYYPAGTSPVKLWDR